MNNNNYSLDQSCYTLKNALLWGNCAAHFNKATEGSMGLRVVHILIGIVESIPIFGQIASIFEKIIASKKETIPSLQKNESMDSRLNNIIQNLRKSPRINNKEKIESVVSYNLNFLWVNLNPQDRTKNEAQNIFGKGLNHYENAACIKSPEALRILEENENSLNGQELEDWNNIKETFSYKISKWADAQPENTQINLWYDSALVTQTAQQNTFRTMHDISKSREVNLQMRDIRQLTNIEGEIGNALHPATPVFFRVDLLKALIADQMMKKPEEGEYTIISDVDIEPLPPEQLLDKDTVDDLNDYGYVFGLNDKCFHHFENSFFVFNTQNEAVRNNHYETIIQQVSTDITNKKSNSTFRCPFNSQTVYTKYPDFFEKMDDEKNRPRKELNFPPSQFNGANLSIPLKDHRSESFNFLNDPDIRIPHTIGGRSITERSDKTNTNMTKATQIESLVNWNLEPLAATVVLQEI